MGEAMNTVSQIGFVLSQTKINSKFTSLSQRLTNARSILLITSYLLLCAQSVLSETYLIDFNTFELPGGNWNSLQSNQTTNVSLIDDETGVTGAATLSHTLGGVDSTNSGGWTAGNVGWVHTAAANDGIYSVTNGSLTFNGLSNGNTYAIDVVAVETLFPSVADFKVEGQFADSNRLGTTALGDDWDTATDGLNNWLTWDAVIPSNGAITLTTYAPGGYTTINAIRIRSVGIPNNPPTSSSFVANPTEGITHFFSTADFPYNDADGDPLDHVLVDTVPVAGTLYLDANNNDSFNAGEELTDGAVVSKANLDAGHLQYIQNGTSNSSFSFEVSDGIEASNGNYVASLNITAVPANVTAVNVPNDSTYILNDTLNFSVAFSKNVTVGGTPVLLVTIGSDSVMANFQNGSGGSVLSFSYTVQSGDFDDNGIVINGLNLNGGTITSNGGLDANLSLNAVGDTSQVLIDAVAPLVQSVTRQNPSSSPTSADSVTLRYTFTEAVNNVQDSNFFSNNPSVINNIHATPVSGMTYDVEFSGANLAEFNGTIVFGFITAGITDLPGNNMTSSSVVGTNDNNYTFENIYFIGGTVSGLLAGNYFVLTNNGGDDKIITQNGAYVFNTPLVHNESYEVVMDLEPNDPIQPCLIINASSSINSADVTDIDVSCEIGNDLIYRDGFEAPVPD